MKKWILRLLTVVVVGIGVFLLFVNIISGTGETQKNGLQQALSQATGGTASFTTLNAFNLIPQFKIDIEGLSVDGFRGKGNLKAQTVLVAFGAMDLMQKNRKIEAFKVTDLTADPETLLPVRLNLKTAEITKGATDTAGLFVFDGAADDKPFKGQIAMVSTGGAYPKYTFNDSNDFTMNVGAGQLSGQFSPYHGAAGEVHDAALMITVKGGEKRCPLTSSTPIATTEFLATVLPAVLSVKKPADFEAVCKRFAAAQ